MNKNLIPLQSAYIRQSRDVDNNAWNIFTEGNLKIGQLSSDLSPKQAMSYLHFARKFELDALNIGIRFGEAQEHDKSEVVFQKLKAKIDFLEKQNIGLSENLERLIIGDEE